MTGGGGTSGGAGGAGGTGGWVTGDYFSLLSGIANKAFIQPCTTGSDCQMNSSCWHPKTSGACGHSKCDVGGQLNWGCDPCVRQVCKADQTCCTYPDTVPNGGSCAHSMCSVGAKLAKDCDEDGADCVEKICDSGLPGLDNCCKATGSWDAACVAAVTSVCGLSCPLSPTGTWTSSCVAKVATSCDATCDTSPPIDEEGQCKEWFPGQKDPSCAGVDLALGITCANTIPVCNHGNTAAPSGIRVVHYPANSNQYPKCNPDQAHPQLYECFTTKPIAPGQCSNDLQYWDGSAWVPGCGQLVGNREIMVNPPVQSGKPTPSGYAGHVSECSCQDNWTLYAVGTCAAPACGHDVISAKKRNLFFLVDRSGSMVSSGLWTPAVAGMTAFFQATTSAGLGVAMEFFPLNSGGSRGDGCASPDPSCSVAECSNAMVPVGTLTAAAAPTDTHEQALVAAFALVHPSDNAAGTGSGTPTYPALDGALKWAKAASTPTERADVVLLTDGPPSRCDTSAANAAALAASALSASGVRTYTLALPGASTPYLDAMAAAGGTGASVPISVANMAAEIQSALGIAASSGSVCESDVPPSGLYDPAKTSVVFDGGSPTALPKQTDKTACGTAAGWYYDSNASPTKLRLCPKSCEDVYATPGSQAKVSFGCP
ncbi:MAG: VWA domain-containing protein [Candidatus Eisenbacteria bacterium]|nr:VWA domain-containing protein [Candidatus Eisenbacteria bacterium]